MWIPIPRVELKCRKCLSVAILWSCNKSWHIYWGPHFWFVLFWVNVQIIESKGALHLITLFYMLYTVLFWDMLNKNVALSDLTLVTKLCQCFKNSEIILNFWKKNIICSTMIQLMIADILCALLQEWNINAFFSYFKIKLWKTLLASSSILYDWKDLYSVLRFNYLHFAYLTWSLISKLIDRLNNTWFFIVKNKLKERSFLSVLRNQ